MDTEDSDSELYQSAREDNPNVGNDIVDAAIPEKHNVIDHAQEQLVTTRAGRISRRPEYLNIYEH